MKEFGNLSNAILSGDVEQAIHLTQVFINEGFMPKTIIDKALIPSMDIVGERFSSNEIFVPEMLISAEAMKESMKLLKPLLTENERVEKVKFVLGTVQGDLHDIGKNIVGMMLEGAGFTVIDLGIDVSANDFVEAIKENDAYLLGLSALLTTTMSKMKDIIDELEQAGLREKVKVIVGGAPVTEKFAIDIKADAYGIDATDAVKKARMLTKNIRSI